MKLIKELGMRTYGTTGRNRPTGLFECFCGNQFKSIIAKGECYLKSCGCKNNPKPPANLKYIKNIDFHKETTVIHSKIRRLIDCTCKCGNVFTIRHDHLKTETNCGCVAAKKRKKKAKKQRKLQKIKDNQKQIKKNSENIRDHRLYGVWRNIKKRCTCSTHHTYKHYGAKGVTVCDEWISSYETFFDWAITKWKPGLEIDKDYLSHKLGIDTPIYSPDTCQFITPKENKSMQYKY